MKSLALGPSECSESSEFFHNSRRDSEWKKWKTIVLPGALDLLVELSYSFMEVRKFETRCIYIYIYSIHIIKHIIHTVYSIIYIYIKSDFVVVEYLVRRLDLGFLSQDCDGFSPGGPKNFANLRMACSRNTGCWPVVPWWWCVNGWTVVSCPFAWKLDADVSGMYFFAFPWKFWMGG